MSEKLIEKLLKNLSSNNCLAILSLAAALPSERIAGFLATLNELAPAEVMITREFEMIERRVMAGR